MASSWSPLTGRSSPVVGTSSRRWPTSSRSSIGTHHIAAASILQRTGAIVVVVFESAVVRIYVAGRLASEILPELWLLRRYIPHLRHTHRTEHRADNVVAFSAAEQDAGAPGGEPG